MSCTCRYIQQHPSIATKGEVGSICGDDVSTPQPLASAYMMLNTIIPKCSMRDGTANWHNFNRFACFSVQTVYAVCKMCVR